MMKSHFNIPPSIERRLQIKNDLKQSHEKQRDVLKPSITISREYGCKAYPLAKLLQDHLNEHVIDSNEEWTVLDRLLLDRIAIASGYSKSELEHITKVNPNYQALITNIAGFKHADSFEVFKYIKAMLIHFAQIGNSIIIGRGGVIVTQDMPNILHVRLIAPMAYRAKNISQSLGLSIVEAERHIKSRQNERDDFINHFTQRDTSDPTLYHLVINNEKCTTEQISKIILAHLESLAAG
ncbi:MAG: cytidylate kinase-like family protein [Candidatus Marinimicrobia bacterium]|nr:cytidylate kinase-like family protein [Candidatus Neomarinimicrobiota bacterium]